jgi:hypothetical protein
MSDNMDFQPSADFVVSTMKRINRYQSAKSSYPRRVRLQTLMYRYLLGMGGALFGILQATLAF